MQGPIRTQERFEETLDKVYLLLQKIIRINSMDYVKLGCYCIQLCQYVHSEKFCLTETASYTYQKIHCVLSTQKTQRMLGRLGLQLFLSDTKEIMYRNNIIIGPAVDCTGLLYFSES
jgi:hypothetical protein